MERNIYIGWDSREDIAYQVAEHSILRRSKTHNTSVKALKQTELREQQVYWRDVDKLGSTEFTITRFLVPHLNNYTGWAVFCDCDTVWLVDPNELFSLADNKYAVMVVKHQYDNQQGVKMDNKVQLPYPRKNWSSVILWNCAHPKNKHLTTDIVNTETPKYLHRFGWLDDSEIGSLPNDYNWLVGWHQEPADGTPKILHYTEGGPWFEKTRHCEYDLVWKHELINLYTS